MEAMRDFLDLSPQIIERVDDSCGYVGDVFSLALKDLGQLYGQAKVTTEACVEDVFRWFTNDDHGLFCTIIVDFKAALGETGLNLLKQKLKEDLSTKKTSALSRGLKAIADCQKDVDGYIDACLIGGDPGLQNQLAIARRLLDHWRTDEAQQWIKKAEQEKRSAYFYPQWEKEISSLKSQALELSGQYDAANQERIALFKKTIDTDVYEDVLRHISVELQISFKSEAVQMAFDFHDATQALRFLSDTQGRDSVSKFIRMKHALLNGKNYIVLRCVAKKITDYDPLGAVLLYRKLLETIMGSAVSKYYKYAVKDLKCIEELNGRVNDWEGYVQPIAYFKAFEQRHKKKYGFWDLYKVQ